MSLQTLNKFVLVLVACTSAALACRYTVRDIGFVDLLGREYRLCVRTDDDLVRARALLEGSNVDALKVDPDESPGHPASALLRDDQIGAVLVDRYDRAHPIRGAPDSEASPLDEVVSSPFRERLADQLIDAFLVIVIAEGPDDEVNEAATRVVGDAIARLRELEPQLPRPLAGDLEVVRLPRTDAEPVTRWAMGLAKDTTEIVVLYGSLKMGGEPIREISMGAVLQQIALIGQSCECETSRDWSNEPHLPHRWTAERASKVASTLGFDPASPMVKAEAARIIDRGVFTGERSSSDDDPLGLFLGYSETSIGSTAGNQAPEPQAPDAPTAADKTPPSTGTPIEIPTETPTDDPAEDPGEAPEWTPPSPPSLVAADDDTGSASTMDSPGEASEPEPAPSTGSVPILLVTIGVVAGASLLGALVVLIRVMR